MTSKTAEVVLKTGRLRWSSPELFNDPAEFQRIPRFEPGLKESVNALLRLLVDAALGVTELNEAELSGPATQMLALLKIGLACGVQPEVFLGEGEEARELDQLHEEMIRSYLGTEFIQQARVMCLTANHSNPAMWANYAENHAGCLLGFRHIHELHTPFIEAKPVTYLSEPPVICSGLDFYLYCDQLGIGQRIVDSICYTKRSEWQYEEEWRAITWRASEGEALFGDYRFQIGELDSLTFGLRTSVEDKAELSAIASSKYPECRLYQIEHEYGEFRRCPL